MTMQDDYTEDDRYDWDRNDASQYCRHGTFIGSWWGPDLLCGACEEGISDDEWERVCFMNTYRRILGSSGGGISLGAFRSMHDTFTAHEFNSRDVTWHVQQWLIRLIMEDESLPERIAELKKLERSAWYVIGCDAMNLWWGD